MSAPNQDLERLSQETATSLQTVQQIDEMVASIYDLTARLKQHPNQEAYTALANALQEVVDTWEVTNDAFQEVWQLYKANGDLKDASEGLLDIGDFQLRSLVGEGRGHCHTIGEIYRFQLRDWFAQVLPAEEQQTMENIFGFIGHFYLDVFQQLELFAEETEIAANEVLDLVLNDRPDEARKVAGALLQTIRPLRTSINRSLVSLRQVQQEFSTIAVAPRPVASAAPAFWTGELANVFHELLIAGYDYGTAEQMLKFQLSKRLDLLVASGGFSDVAFDLIDKAEKEGWIVELVQAAHKENPTDTDLADFASRIADLQTN